MDLIDILKICNRKERYHVVNGVVGNMNNVSPKMRKAFDELWKITLPNSNIFVALDYHLDWISSSLFLYQGGYDIRRGNKRIEVYDNNNRKLRPQQFSNINSKVQNPNYKITRSTHEDIDFIIVYKDEKTERYMIIMMEAKCDTAWDFTQLGQKVNRINDIHNYITTYSLPVDMRFALYSPKYPTSLNVSSYPDFMKLYNHNEVDYIEMDFEGNLLAAPKAKNNGVDWYLGCSTKLI